MSTISSFNEFEKSQLIRRAVEREIEIIGEEKLKFILAWKSGLYTVSDLCRMHGVSRVTGYRLINRYKEEGENCLLEQSKRPKNSSPHKTPLETEQAIIKLRTK